MKFRYNIKLAQVAHQSATSILHGLIILIRLKMLFITNEDRNKQIKCFDFGNETLQITEPALSGSNFQKTANPRLFLMQSRRNMEA